MGADLYIEPIYKETQKKYEQEWNDALAQRDSLFRGSADYVIAQAKVEEVWEKMNADGYFRDSYNNSSLLWVLGLSWWEDIGKKYVNKRGYITTQKARELLTLIENLPFVKLPEESEDWARAEIEKYFIEKRQKFAAFLRLAIKKRYSIAASI